MSQRKMICGIEAKALEVMLGFCQHWDIPFRHVRLDEPEVDFNVSVVGGSGEICASNGEDGLSVFQAHGKEYKLSAQDCTTEKGWRAPTLSGVGYLRLQKMARKAQPSSWRTEGFKA